MVKRNLLPILLAVAVFTGGTELAAFALENPGRVARALPDSALNDRVETLLRTDIGLAGSRFRVQTAAGIVTVGGTVPDPHAARRAIELASAVTGVREVRNGMVVASPK